jgi:hypothetical protein
LKKKEMRNLQQQHYLVVDRTSPPGHLRIVGSTFTADVYQLPLVIGRQSSKSSSGANEEESFLAIGDAKTLSRKHASISWDEQLNSYVIECFSKNGLTINNKMAILPSDGRKAIKDRTKIEISEIPFYVVYPVELVDRE